MTSKGKTWSYGTNSRFFLPSDVNLMLNLSNDLTQQDGKLRQKEDDGKTFVCDKLDRAFLS